MWAIRQLPTSTAHWEPLEGADGATLTVTSASLSPSLLFSLLLLFFLVCVLFLPLPCGLHPSDWHACSRPTLSHHISPPAIRGLTALRSLGNWFGCEQNFKHRVLPDLSPHSHLSLSLSLLNLSLSWISLLNLSLSWISLLNLSLSWISRSLSLSLFESWCFSFSLALSSLYSALPPSPYDPWDSRCASECVMTKEKVQRRWRERRSGS